MIPSPLFAIIDDLLTGVRDAPIADVRVGLYWTAVQSRSVGLSLSPPGRAGGRVRGVGSLIGMSGRELAQYAKSWNATEAAIGAAAINSLLAPDGVPGNGFDYIIPRIDGKKVAVIGHFPVIDRLVGCAELKVIDRYPAEGEYPDYAAEYILPQSEVVVITGSALANKTLPRLLELAHDAYTAVVGPSTPMSPVLFSRGADVLAGVRVVGEREVLSIVSQGGALKDMKPHLQYLVAAPR